MNRGRSSTADPADENRGRPDRWDDWRGDQLDWISVRIYKTYGARREAAKRLQARSTVWNSVLVFTAIVVAVAACLVILDRKSLGFRGEADLAVLGLLSLVASLIVASAKYDVRAERHFRGYRALQELASRADLARGALRSTAKRNTASRSVDVEYQRILDESENHTGADHFRASPPIRRGSRKAQHVRPEQRNDVVTWQRYAAARVQLAGSWLLTLGPFLLLAAPIGLALRILNWLLGA
jgi:conflict system pore-forming effector with SLATT domain